MINARKNTAGIAVGTATMLGMCALFLFIVPLLVSKEILSQDYIQIFALIIHAICIMTGLFVSGIMSVKRLTAMACEAGVYYIIFLCVGMLFYNGITTYVFYTFLVCVGSVLISYTILNPKRSHKKRTRKRTHR